MSNLVSLFSYPFMQRALFVGLLVSPAAALLGVTLVLRRFSMIGDGLSHVGFGALSLALALSVAPLPVALPIVTAAAFFLLRMQDKSLLGGDAGIALVSSSALALGVVITSLSNGTSTDVYDLLFGSILSMENADVFLCLGLSAAVLFVFLFCYRSIFAITFDEDFAHTKGVPVPFYKGLIALLTAVTIVVGMRIMGAMLISSLIIFPALSSMQLFRTFRSVTVCAAIVSVFAFTAGLLASFWFSLPTGASIVLANLAIFLVFTLLKKLR